MSICHLVLFKIREGIKETDQAYKDFDQAVADFPKKYRGIVHQWQGRAFNGPHSNGWYGPKGWDYSIMMIFDSMDALEEFNTHPEHIEMSNVHSEAVCDRKTDLMTFDWVDKEGDRGVKQ